MSRSSPKPIVLGRIGTTHCAIEASAGTGKTYLLEHLVIDLIMQKVPLNKILVVTFTTKATMELKARIRTRLEKIITSLEDQKITEPGIINDPVWEVDAVTYLILKDSVANLNKINISTIHSFCQQVMEDAAFESGQLFKQTVTYGNHIFNHVFKKVISTQLDKNEAGQTLITKALKATGGVAGLIHLLQTAIKERINLELPNMTTLRNILKNFPTTAAKNYVKEFRNYQASSATTKRSYGPISKSLKMSNIGSGSYKAIGNRLEKILRGIDVFRDSDIPGLFWSEISPLEINYVQEKLASFRKISDSVAIAEISAIADACTDLASNAYDFKAVIVATLLPALFKELTSFKHKRGLVDFDDMILMVNQTINSNQGEPLVQRLRDRFQVALIDEFQDTDSLQWGIFSKLFLDSKNHRLILVGDPKQAIYGFRGGDLPTYTAAMNTIQTITGKKAEELLINFRSSPEMIAAQCKIFQGHVDCPFFTGRNANLFKPNVCGNPELKLQEYLGKPIPPIHIIEANCRDGLSTRRSLANGIALAIKEAIRSYEFEGNPIKPEHVMVLTSSAKEGLEMASALKAVGVAHRFFRQDGLFVTPEANAILDLLLAIDRPNNVSIRAKALLGPFFSFSFEEVEQCRNLSKDHPALTQLFAWQKLVLSGKYGEFFARIVSDSGITQRLLFFSENERSLTNILHLLELLQKETLTSHYTPLDLAIKVKQWINGSEQPHTEDANIQRIEKLTDAVQILTIHKSKGLEAPIVAVYGGFSSSGTRTHVHHYHDSLGRRKAWIGSLKFAPIQVQNLVDAEKHEDYQRLLYVALTRAKAQLILPRIVIDQNCQNDNTANNNIAKIYSNNWKGVYHCVNQQLSILSNELDKHSAITNCSDKTESEQTMDATDKQINHSTTLLSKLVLPNFSNLAKICRPMREYSYTDNNNYIKQPPYQSYDRWQVEQSYTYKTTGPTSDYQAYKDDLKLETVFHNVLQLLPLNSVVELPMVEWLKEPVVARLFENKVPPVLRNTVAVLVYRVITSKFQLPKIGTIALSSIKQLVRNLDFITTCPGQKDLISGSIDTLFQWHEKTYILDWKMNQLDSYCPAKLQTVVEKYYLLQAKIHIVATCRFLGIASEKMFKERFGCLIYAFTRGLPSEGIWTLNPSWKEVKDWDLKLEQTQI